MGKHLDKEAILKTNTKIDLHLVEKQKHIEDELAKLGIDIRPKFNIEPSLGLTHYLLQSHKSEET